jgi:hypothetical protein
LASNIFEIFSRRLRMHIEKKYSAERDITPHRSTKTASNESLNYYDDYIHTGMYIQ